MNRFPIVLLMLSALVTGCGNEAELPVRETPDTIPITSASPEAYAQFLEGRELYESLRYVEAAELFQEAIELDPDFALAHLYRASTTESRDAFFASLNTAEKASASASVGEQLLVKAFVYASQGKADEEFATLQKLEALYPKDPRVHVRFGQLHMRRQNFEKASTHYRHALELDPSFAPAWNMLGYARRNASDFDGARDAFQHYIDLLPTEANPYDSYAELLMEAGDYVQSIEMYRKALEIAPDFWSSHVGLIVNYSLTGRHDLAIESATELFNKATDMPAREQAMTRLAGAHLHARDIDAALSVLDRLALLGEAYDNPSTVALARELAGDVLLLIDKNDSALAQFKEALELRRGAVTTTDGRLRARKQFLYKATIASVQAGRKLDAAGFLAEYRREADDRSPLDRRRLLALEGFAAMSNGQFAEAVTHFSKSGSLDPVVQYFLAVAHDQLGDGPAALRHARQAAYRNTLSVRLPYYRQQALALIEKHADSAPADAT